MRLSFFCVLTLTIYVIPRQTRDDISYMNEVFGCNSSLVTKFLIRAKRTLLFTFHLSLFTFFFISCRKKVLKKFGDVVFCALSL